MIVSSRIISESVEADGRRLVHELHIDSDGHEWQVTYVAEADADTKATLQDRVPRLNQQIANRAAERKAVEEAEAARDAVLKELSVEQVAAVLMVDESEAAKRKEDADRRDESAEQKDAR